MASTKPVIDGFHSYGYEMMYLYLVQLTAGTLQDGRAVEHWRPETGEVNTSNVNFPWAASTMAGSIWKELTKEEQTEFLMLFHPRRYTEAHQIIPMAKQTVLMSQIHILLLPVSEMLRNMQQSSTALATFLNIPCGSPDGILSISGHRTSSVSIGRTK
jgi:hypothetical protein